MKKLIAKTALVVLVLGGSILGGTASAAADTPQGCLAARNMVNDGMYHAMSVDNLNGNLGMHTAVVESTSNVSQTPACQP